MVGDVFQLDPVGEAAVSVFAHTAVFGHDLGDAQSVRVPADLRKKSLLSGGVVFIARAGGVCRGKALVCAYVCAVGGKGTEGKTVRKLLFGVKQGERHLPGFRKRKPGVFGKPEHIIVSGGHCRVRGKAVFLPAAAGDPPVGQSDLLPGAVIQLDPAAVLPLRRVNRAASGHQFAEPERPGLPRLGLAGAQSGKKANKQGRNQLFHMVLHTGILRLTERHLMP